MLRTRFLAAAEADFGHKVQQLSTPLKLYPEAEYSHSHYTTRSSPQSPRPILRALGLACDVTEWQRDIPNITKPNRVECGAHIEACQSLYRAADPRPPGPAPARNRSPAAPGQSASLDMPACPLRRRGRGGPPRCPPVGPDHPWRRRPRQWDVSCMRMACSGSCYGYIPSASTIPSHGDHGRHPPIEVRPFEICI